MFYRMRIDADVAPELAVARLRAAVRPTVGFWESITRIWKGRDPAAPPFVGWVRGARFHIRRDITSRNSFLPLIWGRIEPAENGSRLDATLFIHPLVWMFTILWAGAMAFGEWQIYYGPNANPNVNVGAARFFPLIWILVMLVVGGISFFREIGRTRTLLTAALENAAIKAPPHSNAPAVASALPGMPGAGDFATPESSTLRTVFVLSPLALGLAVALGANWYGNYMRSNGAAVAAMELATHSPAVRAALGAPVKAGAAVRGVVHNKPEASYAVLAIPVSGPSAKGTLYVVANRAADRWDIERETLHIAKGASVASGAGGADGTKWGRRDKRYRRGGRDKRS